MKPAKKRIIRKRIIIILAFVLIVTAVNTNAAAANKDHSSSNTSIALSTDALVDISTVLLTEGKISLTNEVSLVAGSEDSNVTAGSVQAVPVSDEEVQALTPAIISDMKSSFYMPIPLSYAGQVIADFAVQFNGYKYVYGAESPSVGFDCSGLAYYIYNQFGYSLPRTASVQYKNGTAVEKADLQPGDLVFFATYGGHSVTHVGIYIGNNEFINATTTGRGVKICNLDESYWSNAWVGAKRILTTDNLAAFS